MGSCSSKNPTYTAKEAGSQRTQIIRSISLFKANNSTFRRETQFITFSILDRLYGLNFFSQKQRDVEITAASLILLASKYNDVKAIKMERILHFFKNHKLSKQNIIQSEGIILQALDFTLPTQTAYSSLARRINMEKSRNCSQFLLKSMKLLTLSIRQYPMLVLDPKFGNQIYDLIWDRKTTKRMTGIYRNVIKKQKQALNCLQKNPSFASMTTQASSKSLNTI